MKQKRFAVWIAALLLLSGCGGGGSAGNTMGSSPASSAPSVEAAPDWGGDSNYWEMAAPGAVADIPQGGTEGGSIYQNPGAKLIRRAELNIQTEQFDQSVAALNQLVAGCGGYFEMANLYSGSWRDANASRSGDYTVRIPAERYHEFLSGAGDLGYVTSRTESSDDVGAQYYDIEARLKTQRTKQERLLSLLERAESMEDIIALESALSDVEYQIEMYSSDLNRYDALVDFATFQIYLSEVGQVTREVGETASLGARMADGVQTSVRNLGQGIQDLLIWGSYHLFLVVILAAVAAAAVLVGNRELKKIRKRDKEMSNEEQKNP